MFAKDYGTEADLRQAVELLVERNVDVNAATDDGITAIHLAAQGGLDSVVRVLAKAGANLDAKDKKGRTPVDMAMGVGGRGRAGDLHRSTNARQSCSRNWVHLNVASELSRHHRSPPS